jgi:DNA helicase-2/ATP-dependent DNA helicase PcrA
MTRAKELLYLVRAHRRSLLGGSNVNPPSRFLQDIPSHLTRSINLFEEGEKRVSFPNFIPLEVGEHVQHATFGEGIVVSCIPTKDDQEVEVAFDGVGVKKLLLSLAPLERKG